MDEQNPEKDTSLERTSTPWPFLAGSQPLQIPQARLALAPAEVGRCRRLRSRARPRSQWPAARFEGIQDTL